MKSWLPVFFLIAFHFFIVFLPNECRSQSVEGIRDKRQTFEKLKPYINIGYITNFGFARSKCDKVKGGSIRAGLLTKGKVGFYMGYAGYKTDLYDTQEYYDKGSALLLGIDFLLVNDIDFQWYLQAGISKEKFESVYYNSNLTDSENVMTPQLGFMFHVKRMNGYVGMGTTFFNIGIGVTF